MLDSVNISCYTKFVITKGEIKMEKHFNLCQLNKLRDSIGGALNKDCSNSSFYEIVDDVIKDFKESEKRMEKHDILVSKIGALKTAINISGLCLAVKLDVIKGIDVPSEIKELERQCSYALAKFLEYAFDLDEIELPNVPEELRSIGESHKNINPAEIAEEYKRSVETYGEAVVEYSVFLRTVDSIQKVEKTLGSVPAHYIVSRAKKRLMSPCLRFFARFSGAVDISTIIDEEKNMDARVLAKVVANSLANVR